MILNKSNIIKIPRSTVILYDKKNKVIVILGCFFIKSLRFQRKNNVDLYKSVLKVNSSSNLILGRLRQLFIEVNYILFKKLKLVGVGYKIFRIKGFKLSIFSLILGYSHSIYFKVSRNILFNYNKKLKLFFYGCPLIVLSKIASLIKSHKVPEPYKGKGILNETEDILLKRGKKV